MRDDDLRDAVEQFLDRMDAAFDEYDQGYADADATLRVVRRHAEELEARVDGDE